MAGGWMQLFLGGTQDGFIIKPTHPDYQEHLDSMNPKDCTLFLCRECKCINYYSSLCTWYVNGKKSCVNCNHVVGPWPKMKI